MGRARGGAGGAAGAWAGDDTLLFVEWEASAPRSAGLVERFDLRDGLALAARQYFDTSGPAFAAHG